MNPKLKKIIIREVLILLFFVTLWIIIAASINFFTNKFEAEHRLFEPRPEMTLDESLREHHMIAVRYSLNMFGMAIAYLGYPVYLLIRFIAWGWRSLRRK